MIGVTHDEFIEWLERHPDPDIDWNLIGTVNEMIASPETSTTSDGYIVWADGSIPTTPEELAKQISYALDAWTADKNVPEDERTRYKRVSDTLYQIILRNNHIPMMKPGKVLKCDHHVWQIDAPSGRYIVAGPLQAVEKAVQKLKQTSDTAYQNESYLFRVQKLIPDPKPTKMSEEDRKMFSFNLQ